MREDTYTTNVAAAEVAERRRGFAEAVRNPEPEPMDRWEPSDE